MPEELAPRGLGELFVDTYRIVFGRFFKLLTAYLMILVPVAVAGAVLQHRPGEADRRLWVAFALLTYFVWTIPRAAGLLVVADYRAGTTTPLRRCLGLALRKTVTLMGLAFVVSLFTTLGLLLLVVPGLVVIAMFAVAAEAAVFEDLPMARALGRSRELTRRRRIFTLVFLALVLLSVAVPAGIVEALVGAVFGKGLIGATYEAFRTLITTLVLGVAAGVLYLDLRVRKEALTADGLGDRLDRLQEALPRPPVPPARNRADLV
jgi:hypothetical protein